MSETSNDATITTTTATANNNCEGNYLSSPYPVASNGTRSSSDPSSPNGKVMDKEINLISPQNEKLNKESKKQAMGDVLSGGDPMKSAVPRNPNDNANNPKQSKGTKTDGKPTETKKVQTARLSLDGRRRNDVFYAGHGRRGSINSGSRSTTYTSREYWRPHSVSGHSGGSLRGSNPTKASDNAEAAVNNNNKDANECAAATESLKNANFHANTVRPEFRFNHRSQVTRTFHNGALRANRTWRNNLTTRSRSQPVTSELSCQSLTENAVENEKSPQVSNGATTSRTGETHHSLGNNRIFNQRNGKFPIIYVAPTGTISILLDKGVAIEIAVDRAIRVLCHDKFSTVCNSRGSGSCILHKKARIFQQDEKVFCNFGPSLLANEKAAVFGTQGVLFTMSHLSEAYLVSSAFVKGTLSVSLGRLQFPSLDYDFTVRMFFTDSQTGHQFTQLCKEIVQEARYGIRSDGTLTLTINGVYIKQNGRGDVEVNCRPKHISCSPTDGVVHVRTNMVDMGVQEDDKAFVKRGLKRIHVSRSGMVVSDGNCITSMDHFGHIVSST